MTPRAKMHYAASRIHKWLALVLGAQLLIWLTSGVLMSYLPIEKVRGEHLVDRSPVHTIPSDSRLVNPAALLTNVGAPIEAINWHMVANRAVAEVTTAKGVSRFDGITGALLAPVDANEATVIVNAAWKAEAKPQSTAYRVIRESPRYRGTLPAWRIAFSDPDATSVFLAADTGNITAVRTGTWRLYDFFWILHIMDWKNHEDFNTPWLLGFAFTGLLLGLAGTVLLFMRSPIRLKKRSRPLTEVS